MQNLNTKDDRYRNSKVNNELPPIYDNSGISI